MGTLVKHHNDLNTVSMRKWTAEEMNFFFSIIAKSRNEGTKTLVFNTDELKELVNFSQRNAERWRETIKNCARKVVQLVYFEETEKCFSAMTLFSRFDVNLEDKTIEIEVSKNFNYILNKLDAQFTQYELEEFTKIRSTYAKTGYRLLKQWRTIGKKEFKTEEFKLLMDIPVSYKSSEIDRAVLKPILAQLAPFFENLKVKKVKSNKKGNPVLGYVFTWKPEKTEKWVENKYKKNDYYKPKKSNVPEWADKPYKTQMTPEEQLRIEQLKKEMLDD